MGSGPGDVLVRGGRVVVGDRVREATAVVCRSGRIERLVAEPAVDADPELAGVPVLDAAGGLVTPGLIDVHVHGAVGRAFAQADPAAWDAVLAHFDSCGITLAQASLGSAPLPDMLSVLDFVDDYRRGSPFGSRVHGVHMEGPFLSVGQCGAHDPAVLRVPDAAAIAELPRHAGALTMVTLAPELPRAVQLTRALAGAGVVVAAGHSEAGPEDLAAAVDVGCSHLTHLWSGMSNVHREGPWRRPGLTEAALASHGLTAEVIADGRHLPSTLLEIAWRCLADRLCVVSDGTQGTGLPEGTRYGIGTVECVVHDGVGMVVGKPVFGGSVTTLDAMVRHLHEVVGLPVAAAVRTATTVPARVLRLPNKGIVAPGADADLAVFDDRFRCQATVKAGEVVYTAAAAVAA